MIAVSAVTPYLAGAALIFTALNKYASGDAAPSSDSGSGRHPIEPTLS